jgi:hypothetical protein
LARCTRLQHRRGAGRYGIGATVTDDVRGTVASEPAQRQRAFRCGRGPEQLGDTSAQLRSAATNLQAGWFSNAGGRAGPRTRTGRLLRPARPNHRGRGDSSRRAGRQRFPRAIGHPASSEVRCVRTALGSCPARQRPARQQRHVRTGDRPAAEPARRAQRQSDRRLRRLHRRRPNRPRRNPSRRFQDSAPRRQGGDDKKGDQDKKHGGSKSVGEGAKTYIEVHGDQERQWGTPTDPHEVAARVRQLRR